MDRPNLWGREPALIAGAVRAIILAAVAFGLRWTPEQIGALMLALEAVLTVLVRQSSTAIAAPVLSAGTEVTTPARDDAVVRRA